MAMANDVVLGSGKIYITRYTEGTVIGGLAQYCKEENQLGWIKGGASLEYKPTTYEIRDDLNVIYRRFLTSEAATFKTGILTWNLDTLERYIGNHTYYEEHGKKIVKLGGNGAREMDKYLVVFEHTYRNGDKLYVGLAATNDAGLTLQFNPEKETVVDAEFAATSNDVNGCLVIIEQVPQEAQIFSVSKPAITVAKGKQCEDMSIIAANGVVSATSTDAKVECIISSDNDFCYVIVAEDCTATEATITLTNPAGDTCTITVTIE